MKVGVTGAGWAGLSAALELHRLGHEVTVFEAGHTLGGRARRVQSRRLATGLDNGQHILLGAYDETLTLMHELGLSTEQLLHTMPLTLQSADGLFRLRLPKLPNALAFPYALLSAQGLSWTERWRLASQLARLMRTSWKLAPGLSVLQWLEQGRQSQILVQRFWEPLCLASMNTRPDEACAQLFANVLRDSLGAGVQACRILIPRVDLSSLWPEKLPQAIKIRHGQTIRQLMWQPDHVLLNAERFDAAIIATNVQPAQKLLKQLPSQAGSDHYLAVLQSFRPLPIATLTLNLSDIWRMPHAMLMLTEAPGLGQFGQWLFHCNEFMQEPLSASRLNIVISHATDLGKYSTEQVMAGVLEQIKNQASGFAAMPPVQSYELITEKRATFAATPQLQRPTNISPWHRIAVAGDWTDTDYPAVLEGAVRSGKKAARALQHALGQA